VCKNTHKNFEKEHWYLVYLSTLRKLKYIGGLHTYLCHMILMFNLTNLDEVCVQATHIDSKGKSVHDVSSAKPV
jgi:hypothetical protein